MIRSLFVSTLLLALMTSIVFTISPMIIVHNMGISIVVFSLIEGFCEFLANMMKLSSGLMIDRWKKQKFFLLGGIVLATLSKPFLYMGSGLTVLLSKAMERLSNGLVATPRDVIVTECSAPHEKGQNYGLILTAKTMGCAVGPFLVAGAMSSGWSFFDHTYTAFLWIMMILGFVSFWVTWAFVPSVTAASGEASFRWKEAFSFDRSFWALISIAALFMLGRFTDGMILLHLKAKGYPEWLYLSTSGVFNLVSAFSSFGVGKILDSRWRLAMYVAVPLGLVGADLCFMICGPLFVPVLGMAFWGFQRSASQILFVSEIARIAPKRFLGTAIGVYYIVTGLCSFTAGAYGGVLADMNPVYFLGLSALFGVLSLLAFVLVRQRKSFGLV
jgi:hypothetical protein